MSEGETTPSTSSTFLTTPLAIVIAGALIALAVYMGGGSGQSQVAGTTNQPTNPAAGQAAGNPTAPTIGDIREIDSTDHVRGPQNAKVTIIEYSDLECPFCKRFHETMHQVVEEYPNDVRWVYRHFPLAQLHSKAEKEAIATECAAEQGKFWELTDLIFEVTPANNGLDLATLPDLAEQAGVPNIAQFEDCLNTDKYKDKVAADLADAGAAGGRGTPYSVVIGPDGKKTPINGAQPLETVKATIDSLL